jgi:hypothetical protein
MFIPRQTLLISLTEWIFRRHKLWQGRCELIVGQPKEERQRVSSLRICVAHSVDGTLECVVGEPGHHISKVDNERLRLKAWADPFSV